jgi:hypothetical protein
MDSALCRGSGAADYKTIKVRRVKYLTPGHLPRGGKQCIHGIVGIPTALSRGKKLLLRIDPVYGILLAVLIILFGPVLLGVRAIYWGLPLLQFYPWHEIAKQSILGGFLPLWNPWLGMGAPLLANAQSALLYPPNWFLWIVPVEYGQGVLMVAHLLWAGIGMAKLSRTLGIGRLGQAAAGLAFMLSGYLAARAWFLTINASVAWLPWIILAGENACKKENGIFDIRLALVLCLQWLAGHWQTSWYTWLILAGWMGMRAFSNRPVWKSALVAGLRILAASLCAGLLGAAQFLPTIGYWLHSQRSAGAAPAAALTYSFWPWRLLTLIAPNLFGNPARGDYWGYANYWEDAIYIGLLPLGLAVLALVNRLRRKGVPGFPYGFLLVLLPLTLILALGKNTPIFPFLFQNVPTFDFFQAPSRIMIGFVFSLCLLAAAGAEGWTHSVEGSWRGAANIGVPAAAAVGVGAGASYLAFIKPSFSSSILAAGGMGILIAGLVLLKYFSRRRPVLARIFPAAAAALVALDLMFTDAGLVPTVSPDLYRAENPPGAEIASQLEGRRILMPEKIRYKLMYNRAFLFRTFSGLSDWMDIRRWELPNVSVLDAIPSANNFDSFVFGRYADLVNGLETLPAEQRDRLLRMMDVGAVWEWPEGAEFPSLRFLPGGAARAWGVCRAEWAISPEEAWQAVMDPQFDPARTVILELGSGQEGTACAPAPQAVVAAGKDPNVVRIEVDFPKDGYLVVADVNDHGWEAFLDGERVPSLQADYVFRAVRIPAGKHIVEYRYTPLAFWAGALSTIFLLLLMLAAVGYTSIRTFIRRNPQGTGSAAGVAG